MISSATIKFLRFVFITFIDIHPVDYLGIFASNQISTMYITFSVSIMNIHHIMYDITYKRRIIDGIYNIMKISI